MSFDPVHDSIEANRTEPNGTKSPSAPKGVSRTTFLTSLLNPESNDITKTDEDNDAQFSDSPSTKKSQISSSEGMEVYVTQPKISDLLTTSVPESDPEHLKKPSSSLKRRRYFIKETPQETKYKEKAAAATHR